MKKRVSSNSEKQTEKLLNLMETREIFSCREGYLEQIRINLTLFKYCGRPNSVLYHYTNNGLVVFQFFIFLMWARLITQSF